MARVWAAGREKQGQVDLRVCVWDHYKQLAYLALRSGGVVWFWFLWGRVNQSHLGAQEQTRWSPKEYKVQRNPAKVCSRTYRVLENTSACSWETLISLSGDTVSVWEIWLAWVFLLSFYSRTENFPEDTGKLLHLGICVQKFWRISCSPLCPMLHLIHMGHLFVWKNTCSSPGVDMECPRFRSSLSERSWGLWWFTLPKDFISSDEHIWWLHHLFLIKAEVWIRTWFRRWSGRCKAHVKIKKKERKKKKSLSLLYHACFNVTYSIKKKKRKKLYTPEKIHD